MVTELEELYANWAGTRPALQDLLRPYCDHFLSDLLADLVHNVIEKWELCGAKNKEANIMDWFTILVCALLLVYTLIPKNKEPVDEKED